MDQALPGSPTDGTAALLEVAKPNKSADAQRIEINLFMLPISSYIQ
jgi:hypothetical protein